MVPDAEIDLSVERLQELDRAIADTSSLIYAEGAGFLAHLTDLIRVSTVPGVIEEIGHEMPTVHVIESASPELDVDLQVVATAEREQSAVISDDKDILARATQSELECYTALEMLELTLLRGKITLIEWDACRKRLLAIANYHPRTVHAGQMLHWAVRKQVG